MMDNFLTIPKAPDYEINSALQVRNKKTGRIIKQRIDPRGNHPFVALQVEGRWTSRRLKGLRTKALEAQYGTNFVPIPSTHGKYEMNEFGDVRNAKTKKVLKARKGSGINFSLRLGKTSTTRSIDSLRWETFGTVKPKSKMRIPVELVKGGRRLFFKSQLAAAKYLAPRFFLTVGGAYRYFQLRRAEIYGWKVTYQATFGGAKIIKDDLIDKVWNRASATQGWGNTPYLLRETVEEIVNATFQVIAEVLFRNDKVSILKFGTFKLRNVVEHKDRNVKTGETIIVPAKKHPSSKAGKKLKAKVNE